MSIDFGPLDLHYLGASQTVPDLKPVLFGPFELARNAYDRSLEELQTALNRREVMA